MHATHLLRQWCVRATLFTRPGCSLCVDAKKVMNKVWQARPFERNEIDISRPDQAKWKQVYDFDVPVVHVDKVKENQQGFTTTTEAAKLMHRFSEAQLTALLDEVMLRPSMSSSD